MAYVCRQEIMNGGRLEIDEAAIAKYGFTQEEAEQLKYRIADINARLLAEFRREYEWLKRIVEKAE